MNFIQDLIYSLISVRVRELEKELSAEKGTVDALLQGVEILKKEKQALKDELEKEKKDHQYTRDRWHNSDQITQCAQARLRGENEGLYAVLEFIAPATTSRRSAHGRMS